MPTSTEDANIVYHLEEKKKKKKTIKIIPYCDEEEMAQRPTTKPKIVTESAVYLGKHVIVKRGTSKSSRPVHPDD